MLYHIQDQTIFHPESIILVLWKITQNKTLDSSHPHTSLQRNALSHIVLSIISVCIVLCNLAASHDCWRCLISTHRLFHLDTFNIFIIAWMNHWNPCSHFALACCTSQSSLIPSSSWSIKFVFFPILFTPSSCSRPVSPPMHTYHFRRALSPARTPSALVRTFIHPLATTTDPAPSSILTTSPVSALCLAPDSFGSESLISRKIKSSIYFGTLSSI